MPLLPTLSRLLAASLLATGLSACQTVRLDDAQFIRSDRVVGPKASQPIDEALARERWPQARMEARQVLVQESGQAVNLNGLALLRPDAQATVLFFGGNLFRIDDAGRQVLDALATCPVNVLMFDYRGFGRSPGEATVERLAADALSIYDQTRLQQSGPLLVHGYSLGSFMAAEVAKQRRVDALVLAGTAPSPRASAEHLLQQRAGWLAPFVRLQLSEGMERVDNRSALSRHTQPTLVLAGGRDAITPAALGRQVYEALPGPDKQFVLDAEASHAALLPFATMRQPYCDFVQRVAQRVAQRVEQKSVMAAR